MIMARRPAHPPARRRWLGLLLAAALLLGATLGSSAAAGAGPLVTFTPTPIPWSAADLVNPLRGYYRWYDAEPIPQARASYDHYIRFGWRQLEPTRGVYDFSAIEERMANAWGQQATFSFRVMAINEFTSPVEVPDYLVQEAGGTYCTYEGRQVWVPNWNSPAFLERTRALMNALGARFNGDQRLGYYDMGIYGHWGEWHVNGLCAAPGTDQTKRAIVDAQYGAFSRSRILMNSGAQEIDAFLYALNKSPRVGVRVDALCSPWFDSQFNSSPAKLAAVQQRWKTAPIVTEFYGSGMTDFSQCEDQVKRWHVASVANAQINAWSTYSGTQQSQIISTGKASGYRFLLNNVTFPSTIQTGVSFAITANWTNLGVTPAYTAHTAWFELRPRGQASLAAGRNSLLNLQTLLPASQPLAVADRFILGSRTLPPSAGNQYDLSLVVLEDAGHRLPMSLAISGATGAGRYPLGTVTIERTANGRSLFLPLLGR